MNDGVGVSVEPRKLVGVEAMPEKRTDEVMVANVVGADITEVVEIVENENVGRAIMVEVVVTGEGVNVIVRVLELVAALMVDLELVTVVVFELVFEVVNTPTPTPVGPGAGGGAPGGPALSVSSPPPESLISRRTARPAGCPAKPRSL